MKKEKITGLLLACLAVISPNILAQVESGPGLQLVATDELKLVFNDADFIHHGQFIPGNSTVVFKGERPAKISGSSPVKFHNLVISTTGKEISLENDLDVSGILKLEEGNLQLNRRTLNLGYTGRIEGERNEARITGSPGGIIKAYAILNAPRGVNPGNLGAEISTDASMGETVIIRGHSAQIAADGRPVVARYYDIQPQFNLNLRATLKLHYLDAELSGDQEDALTVYSSRRGQANWIETGRDLGDAHTNWVVKTEVNQLHRFTLAGATNRALAEQNSKTKVQLFPNPTPGQFTVMLHSEADKEAAINLYDQLGRLLESRKLHFRAGTNNINWDISKYANGTYYLSFGNTDLKTVKIVKE